MILERNYRCCFGEIDIIAKDGDCLVFVEVKAGASPLFGSPHLRITKKKRIHIIRSALHYLKRRAITEVDCRIDVVSISMYKKERPIELIRNAFGLNERGVQCWRR